MGMTLAKISYKDIHCNPISNQNLPSDTPFQVRSNAVCRIGFNYTRYWLKFLSLSSNLLYINILKIFALTKNKCTEEIYWNDQCYLMIDNDLQRNFLQIWSSISTVYETNEIKHYAFVILSVVIKLEVDA